MRKPLVYIAGPYTHPDPVTNTREAIGQGLRIRDQFEVAVLIPHLTLLADMVFPHDVDYWYQFDLDQIPACDAVYRLPGSSTGADRETAFAKNLGLAVLTDEVELAMWLRHFWMVTA